MIKTIISRITLSACCLALAVLMAPTLTSGRSHNKTEPAWLPNPEPKVSVRPILNISDLSVVPFTGTMLVRTRDDVFATINTSGLEPGAAVTAWWVFFNNPHNCATRPCAPDDLGNPAVAGSVANAGGKIVGADGTASYGAFRAAGDLTGVVAGFGTAQGLLNPLKAEIFLVTRTHGAALLGDPAMLSQQLNTYNGGCPPNTCADLQVSIHQP